MEKIKTFLDIVFEKEQIAQDLKRDKDNIEKYNEFVVNELNIYCEDPYDTDLKRKVEFNIMGKMISPLSDLFYEESKNCPYPASRYLFKISEYNNEKYGTVWACYVSFSDPDDEIKKNKRMFFSRFNQWGIKNCFRFYP